MDGTINCLTVKQPWADLIIRGVKDIENRQWESFYRGRLYIHTSKQFDMEGYDWLIDNFKDFGKYVKDLKQYELGKIIGYVDMIDCVKSHSSFWFAKTFRNHGFIFKNPVRLKKPIPLRGQLGIFEVDSDVII